MADEEARRKREADELRRQRELEEAARRKALLAQKDDDEELNRIRAALAHWLSQGKARALNLWRDEASRRRRIDMLLRRVALRWKKDKAYKMLVKLRDFAEAKRIKELEKQAYQTVTSPRYAL